MYAFWILTTIHPNGGRHGDLVNDSVGPQSGIPTNLDTVLSLLD